MPKGHGMSYLPKEKYGHHEPGYPGKISKGSSTPAGYQQEARSHKKSSAGSKSTIKRVKGM